MTNRVLSGSALESQEQQTMKKQNQLHIPPVISEAAWIHSINDSHYAASETFKWDQGDGKDKKT